MNTEILEDIGLSNVEIKVFLTLLELGEVKAGRIIEKTGLQSSSTYHAISSLIKRGLVSYVRKSEVKYYRACNPKNILDYIELKKREYLKILPELEAKQRRTENEGVEFFKGVKGIKTMMLKLLQDAKKGEIYRNFSVDNPEVYAESRKQIFGPLKKIWVDKRLDTRSLFSEKNRYAATKSSRNIKRYLSIPLPPNTSIIHDKVAIISLEGEPSGILITSKSIAKQYSDFFDGLWKVARK
ncbi:hypothetical protein J4447_00870 [Candidatus Pacearchaeota archaeon]|nr:hypothetical protein [Candidatus Pacearchaeota archaeon]